MNNLKCLFLLLLVSSTLTAQDVHFSQFYALDHYLNPAQIGAHNGDMRIAGIYRRQWQQIGQQPITTTGIGFDKAFHYYSHEIDGGILIVRDLFSGFHTVSNKFLLSASYGLSKFSSNWRVGVQTGLVTNSTDLSVQTFPNQWNYQAGMFDQNISNEEVNIRPSQMYLDVNLGLTWNKKIKNVNLSSGLAFSHVNRPKDTYFSQVAERRKIRPAFHTTAEIPINASFTVEPKMFWTWTTKANDLLLGSNIRYKTEVKSITSVYSGVFYRHGIKRTLDAFYPVFGLVYKEFDLGISYDVNVSDLKTGIKRPGTFEFSLKYTLPSSKVKYKIIPCDRY